MDDPLKIAISHIKADLAIIRWVTFFNLLASLATILTILLME